MKADRKPSQVLPIGDNCLVEGVGGSVGHDVRVSWVRQVPVSDTHVGARRQQEGVTVCHTEVQPVSRVVGRLEIRNY